MTAQDRFEVQELLYRFMRSFDEKDWDAMRGYLADTIECDYSSFRGTPPGTLAREDYVEQRKMSLAELRTQHNLSNVSLSESGSLIEVRGNYAILRFDPDFDGSRDKFFHSYGRYRFGLKRIGDSWRIASITQSMLMNDGNPSLHAAARR
jgi:SnoaL-like domain